jgi:hypothetical protein
LASAGDADDEVLDRADRHQILSSSIADRPRVRMYDEQTPDLGHLASPSPG